MKLTKTVYNSQITLNNTSLNKDFSEMKKVEDKISVNKFFQYYEKLFLLIPKTGGNSHSTLFKKSGSYIEEISKNKDRKINALQNKIIELEFKISQSDIT